MGDFHAAVLGILVVELGIEIRKVRRGLAAD
jgi:hypothetical protein